MGLADRRDDVETGCEPVDSAVKGKTKEGDLSWKHYMDGTCR
jgi:hypothetical protein